MNHLEGLSQQYGIEILPEDELVDEPVINLRYHLSWARTRKMSWKLRSVNGENCVLRTPFTKKILRAKTEDLRHTNKRIVAKAKKRNK